MQLNLFLITKLYLQLTVLTDDPRMHRARVGVVYEQCTLNTPIWSAWTVKVT